MTDSHQDIARTRYRQFFSSDLFGAVAVEDKSKNPSLNSMQEEEKWISKDRVHSGRPADQTTAQLFGEYKETNIPPRKSELPEFV
ncbi:hypothetical protein Pmar_PMAR002987 [Perkinsus marinus ATCC 50983]|uniref:Uncharacterized protein n=1 Tax=Perkinsus marinus (strain ATCC 50983 / TXsc) TaxID=423536 RepID=C5LR30_PERM5|nr:hypothetical protein Pmar_PMAR002987 [Perkinsus marinus ATCC 50983]EER00915.1 hypothetical protein Pmar_PMAR002987 [Perkinsus marinus ATCC 50983]|eukprot:XP_002768197.1 hypothetical protein Pmar_PMAR002987 [Perkinsus marinus ATCC 50983]